MKCPRLCKFACLYRWVDSYRGKTRNNNNNNNNNNKMKILVSNYEISKIRSLSSLKKLKS